MTGVADTVPAARRSPRYGEAGYERRDKDDYFTETRCVWALLAHVTLPRGGRLWEPACGDGAIVAELVAERHAVLATDIAAYPDRPDRPLRHRDVQHRAGVDFFGERRCPPGVRALVTNPPFGCAEAFVRHMLALCPRDGLVAALLPADWSYASTRIDLFLRGGGYRLKIEMCWRPNWVEERTNGGRNNAAWYVWKPGWDGDAIVRQAI